ncbi:hypothetical protein [Enterococcus pallens]|uniref:Phage protein n=1 Tax=Enterococcus pallens ATCC BAA-351 TaxID=1158607 RepID=R2QMH5_9ENTE|nr:hypothetical protein [Enterococcus pallens]EOH96388.1 hypothetical protein UAU_01039 [Enterococcus pallens ATCC BAA-351]EOU14399.1 hypothetical protein I588_04755 [Enterococcus pallens ATCC BAA-351]OJG77296.1 hypothetical protein RV10_GL002553 [Enterococcus pallens]
MRTITLNDGEEVTVNPKVNALLLKNLRDKEGFKTKLLINSFVKKEDIDEFVLIDSVFIAYRQANPKGLAYEDFLEKYEFDFEEAAEIFSAVISKKGKQEFAKAFKAKTNKKKR